MRTMDVGRGNALAHKNRVIEFNKAIAGIVFRLPTKKSTEFEFKLKYLKLR